MDIEDNSGIETDIDDSISDEEGSEIPPTLPDGSEGNAIEVYRATDTNYHFRSECSRLSLERNLEICALPALLESPLWRSDV